MKIMKLFKMIFISLIFTSLFSGCIDSVFDFPITYESHPTKIGYTIFYGYNVNCVGSGKYEVIYNCNIPSVSHGLQNYILLYDLDYELLNIFNNSYVRWNISGDEVNNYHLGISGEILANSLLVSDLSGKDASSIDDIRLNYPTISNKYLRPQFNNDILLIDPNNSDIKTISSNIINSLDIDNSFLIAKEIFKWFSENTEYKIHNGVSNVQPAALTLQKRSGDCDDLSFLYISLCRSIGIPARFIRGYLLSEDVFGNLTATPHAWSEVFVGGSIGNNGWIPVECACACDDVDTNINQNFGIESAFHLRLFIDDGSNESLKTSLSGVSYVTYGSNRIINLESFSEVKNYFEIESKKLVVTSEGMRSYQ